MRNLKTDGTFSWSNSAYNSGLGKLRISGTEQETEYLAEYGSLHEDIEMYRINGSPVSQNDFYAYTALQDAKKDVVWRLVTTGNINNLVPGTANKGKGSFIYDDCPPHPKKVPGPDKPPVGRQGRLLFPFVF
jgi:hypothetical protein